MGKHDDARSAGRSKLVPYIPDEDPKARHARRHAAAADARERLEAFCSERGIEIAIKNDGHHWRFVKGQRSADWWPSSAKMVFDQKWERGVHVHGFAQVERLLVARGVASAQISAAPSVLADADVLALIGDLRHARAALRQIQSAAGAPDAAEACRNVIKIAERGLLGAADDR